MANKIVTADKIVTVITKVENREIPWNDIVTSVTIESDDWDVTPPWDNCDGWEHDARPLTGYGEHDGITGSRGYARTSWKEPNILVEIDDIIDKWGCPSYPGASKQVKAELIAQIKRDALDQLVKWYEDGWEYFLVAGEYKGASDSCGGIDSYEYAEEVAIEVAGNIADQLTNEGYIVTGRPTPTTETNAERWHRNYKSKQSSYVVKPR